MLPPTPRPPGARDDALRSLVRLPTLSFLGDPERCEPTIVATNVGSEPAKALLVLLDGAGLCSPQCAGANAGRCSGLIAPGGTWVFTSDAIAAGVNGGVLFSLSASSKFDIGATPDMPEPAADYLFRTLAGRLTGSCEEYRRLRLALLDGALYGGVPLARARGPEIEAHVSRSCSGAGAPGVTLTSGYDGVSGAELDPLSETDGAHSMTLVPVYAVSTGLRSTGTPEAGRGSRSRA